MNNESPLVPQGSFLEQKNKGRARVKIAVFVVLAIHGVGLMALLMQGCQKAPDTTSSSSVGPTNTVSPPVEEAVVPVPPAFVEPTNVSPAADTSTPPVVQNRTEPPVIPLGEQTPPPSNPTPLPTAVQGGATEHKIARGDTLAALAKQYKVSLNELQAANPGVDARRLKPGDTIRIPPPSPTIAAPAPASPSATAAHGSAANVYKVRSGDNLLRIAKKHGVSLSALRKANGLRTDRIKVGQELVIPGRNGAQASTGSVSGQPFPGPGQ